MKLLVSEAVKRSEGLLAAREIRKHCESGRLKAVMYGGQWNIDEASFDKLMHEDLMPDLEMQAKFRRIAIEILEADNPDWREHNWDFDPTSPDPFDEEPVCA